MSEPLFKIWLTIGLPQRIAQLDRHLLAELQQSFDAKPRPIEGREPIKEKALYFVDFIKQLIKDELSSISILRHRYQQFNKIIGRAATEEERQTHILAFAKELGASHIKLAGDKQAFKRWFGQDVVVERYHRRLVETERKVTFYLGRLATWSHKLLTDHSIEGKQQRLWRRLDLEALLKPLLAYEGDSRVRIAAFQCLAQTIKGLPNLEQESGVSEGTLQYVFRSALEHRQETWIQTEAVTLLASLSPSSLVIVLQRRLNNPSAGDDLFVRRCCVRLLCQHLSGNETLHELLNDVLEDPSPAVRQTLAKSVLSDAVEHKQVITTLGHLALNDDSAQVRAMALLQLPTLSLEPTTFASATEIMSTSLTQERDEFVLRVGFKIAHEIHRGLVESATDREPTNEMASQWRQAVLGPIEQQHQHCDQLAVRRWAAQAREQIWSHADEQRRQLGAQLRQSANTITPGKRKTIKSQDVFDTADEDTIGRVMSNLAQEDFGFDLAPGKRRARLTRGHVFGFRSWRLLHELRRSATDKRQGFRHTTGRIFKGTLRAPSGILSELAETKVPGEPLFVGKEAGWRPYLPLVDEVISCIDEGVRATTVRFYSSEGVTELTPPPSFSHRLRARLKLTNNFARYARLRNWQDGDQAAPNSYLQALQKLGFEVRFRAYNKEGDFAPSTDPAVQRFFPVAIPFVDPEATRQLQDYFFSVYENSLTDLAIFLAGMSAVFATRHLYVNHQLRQSRANLPLVVGGWGTRGKSGTERLKAALFNALGYGVVSKTSGCEAMFLHAPAYGKLREMFLFRPYDKATIWEQGNVMRLADQLGVEVFLWECMALTPSYVSVLQQEWVRDDIATITNTYPDHEDLQGPAGVNIPEVMTNFIPKNSVLLSSEEQMSPILRTAAEQKKTRMVSVGWLESGLLPEDMLSRFPYEEHPFNIALVLSLADELEVDHDFALKEMADRVVADLGVLKAYPIADVGRRQLEFVMGMSANERFGCLTNWERMKFADQAWEDEPNTWLTTVVNNRADRVARSQVFANILVEDLRADRHFLIGTNLEGLTGYIKEGWQTYIDGISLWPNNDERPLDILNKMVRHMRIPYQENHVIDRLKVMLCAYDSLTNIEPLLTLWNDDKALTDALTALEFDETDSLIKHLQNYKQGYEEYQHLADQLQQQDPADTSPNTQAKKNIDTQFHQLMWQWFERKLVVMEDPHMSGEQVIQRITDETPPGIHNRIMGMQNIKGTGLDYVYRWQAWELCHKACTDLMSDDSHDINQALLTLINFREYGILSEAFVRSSIEQARNHTIMQTETRQAELQLILSNLDTAMKQRSPQGSANSGGFIGTIAQGIESFLDAGDAVKRRKHANKIYQDLAEQRISHERAALELQALNKRQKGGWFVTQVNAISSDKR